ncbi:MAG: TonB-dependent receptor family protein [Flavobacteriales bacterium]|nr:TonB-dependent receptor family protein [Flavobacteriales bacterium]
MFNIHLRSFTIFFLAVLLHVSVAMAQRPGPGQGERPAGRTVSGSVVDEKGNSVPYASVALRSKRDSTFLRGTATVLDGAFELQLRPGMYELTVSFISYQDKVMDLDLREADVNIGKLSIEPKAELVDEVVISADKSYMELKLDKRVYNVDKDPNNVGKNAQDILETVPSVQVDVDGTVSLRGSSNVRILIDGKPSGLTGISTQDALRQLPGNLIEKIEVVTNASAKYDAEGDAGILNIVLKKDKRAGLNGSFEVNAGYPHNYGASANLNYRTGKFNFFTSIGGQYRQRPGNGRSFQQFFLEDTSFAYERTRQQIRAGVSANGRFGIDYFIDKKTNLTASGMYSRSWNNNTSELNYTDIDENGTVTQQVVRTEKETEPQQNIEANLNFRHTFKTEEQLLTADVRWFVSDDHDKSDLLERGTDYVLNQRTDNVENERTWLFQTDYVHPFNEKVRLETGLKATIRKIDNNYQVDQQNDSTAAWEVLSQFDNNFIYTENVYAAYLMASGKVKRFSMQGGLRAEYSDIRTDLVKTNVKNYRSYISFFPSAHLNYEFASNNSLQLSYSRRISRPRFRDLIPFSSLSDNRNFRAGNPNLNPVFTHSIELGHLKTWDNGTLLSSVYYRHSDGVVQRVSRSDSTGLITTSPINLSKEDAAGVELSFSYSLFKWWRTTFNANIYYSITNGQYENQSFYAETFTANGRFTSKWTIVKKVNIQTSFMYNAPRNTPQGKNLSMYSWDIGLTMDVLKGNGTLTLSARDILNSRRRRWEIDTPTLVSTNDFQWMTRQFVVSFAYRLNQKKKRERGGRGEAGEMDGGGDDY